MLPYLSFGQMRRSLLSCFDVREKLKVDLGLPFASEEPGESKIFRHLESLRRLGYTHTGSADSTHTDTSSSESEGREDLESVAHVLLSTVKSRLTDQHVTSTSGPHSVFFDQFIKGFPIWCEN